MNRALLIALVAATCLVSNGAMAQLGTGTPKEQAACRPDVQKLCRDAGTQSLVVLACLQSQRNKLSNACLKVLESNGQ